MVLVILGFVLGAMPAGAEEPPSEPGSLLILSTPSGAAVRMDGTTLPDLTPIFIPSLPPGPRKLTLERFGFRRVERLVDMGSESLETLDVELDQTQVELPWDSLRILQEMATGDATTAEAARRKLGNLGARGIPGLIEAVRSGDPVLTALARERLVELGDGARRALVMAMSDDEDGNISRLVASYGVAVVPDLLRANRDLDDAGELSRPISEIGAPAIPFLLEALQHRTDRFLAARALGYMGSAAATVLVSAASHPDPLIRESVAMAILESEVPAGSVGEILKILRDDPSPAVRKRVATAMEIEPNQHRGSAERLHALRGGPGLTESLAAALTTSDPAAREQAADELGQIEPPTVESTAGLIIMLQTDPEPSVRMAAVRALRYGRVIESAAALASGLDDPDLEIRVQVMGALSEYAGVPGCQEYVARARSSISQLLRVPELSFSVRRKAYWLVSDLHAWEAVAILRERFSDCGGEEREQILSALARLRAFAAVPLVRQALADPETRRAGLEACLELGPLGRQLSPDLSGLLDDPQSQDRQAIAQALGALADSKSLPALTSLLRDDDREVLIAAAAALGVMGPESSAAVQQLARLLPIDDRDVRVAVLDALGAIGPPARTVASQIAHYLADGDKEVETAAGWALERLGPAAEAAVPLLKDLLIHERSDVRVSAAQALAHVGKMAHIAIAPLIRMLGETDESLVGAALEALAAIGPAAIDAVPRMIPMLSGDGGIGWTAQRAIGGMGSAAVPHLVKALDRPELSQHAAFALLRLGVVASPAIPGLSRMVEAESLELRWTAGQALSAIGPAAVPALIDLLRSRHAHARQQAAASLAQMGPLAILALPELIEALSDPAARWRAAEAIRGLGEQPAAALEAKLPGMDEETAAVARETLWRIRNRRW